MKSIKENALRIIVDMQGDLSLLRKLQEYTMQDGRRIPEHTIGLLYNTCTLLEYLLKDSIKNGVPRQGKANEGKGLYWRSKCKELRCLKEENIIQFSLPLNWRRLSEKVEQYRDGGIAAVVPGYYANRNAGKITERDQVELLLGLLTHHNSLDLSLITRVYNEAASKRGWPAITRPTVRNFMLCHPVEVGRARLGKTRFAAAMGMTVKRERPTAALSMWSIDGWTAELLYQKREERVGGAVTTYHHRLTIVVVLDVSCNYPIGYAIGHNESPELIKEALRSAVYHASELLGSNSKLIGTLQLQSDNYAKKSLMGAYSAIAKHVTPAAVGNAKAKPIEAYFSYLNRNYCKLCNNWSGFGITTNPKLQPNPDAINILKKNFPTEQGVREQLIKMMDLERTLKAEKMQQAIKAIQETFSVNAEQFILHLGRNAAKTVRLSNTGLNLLIEGTPIQYDCFVPAFRTKYAGRQWQVRYLPEAPQRAVAITDGGAVVFPIEAKSVQPMALSDRKPGDAAELHRVLNYNKALNQAAEQRIKEVKSATAELLSGGQSSILGRLLLTDSAGEHKDRYYQELQSAQELLGNITTEPCEEEEEEADELFLGLSNEPQDLPQEQDLNTEEYIDLF